MYEKTETQNVTERKTEEFSIPVKLAWKICYSTKTALKGKPIWKSSIVSIFQQTSPYQLTYISYLKTIYDCKAMVFIKR